MKKEIIFLLVFVMLSIGLNLSSYQKGQDWGGDFALYLNQARGLVTGDVEKVFVDTKYSIDNSDYKNFSPNLYPWGYPLLITPIYYFSGNNLEVYKVFNILFFYGIAFLLWFSFRSRMPKMDLVLWIGLWLSSLHLVEFSHEVLSNLPFVFFLILGFKYLFNLSKDDFQFSVKNGVLMGFVLFIPFLFRTEGILLICTYIAYLAYSILFEKRVFKKELLYPIISFFIIILISNFLFLGGSSKHFDHFEMTSYETVKLNFLQIADSPFQYLEVPINKYLKILILVVFVLGVYVRFKPDLLILIFAIGFLTLFLFWPHFTYRYIIPWFLIFYYFFFHGLRSLNKNMKFPIFLTLGLVLVLSSFIFSYHNLYSEDNKSTLVSPTDAESQEMFDFVINNTEEDDVIVFFKPRIMNFYTGRKSVFTLNRNPEAVNFYVIENNVRYKSRKYKPLNDLDELNNPIVVFRNENFIVVELN
ncbi:hypothetical protein EF405_12250 [Cyclobacteriaceae bacterium YHN15]|nr:hypothetical protein EF405_12250 [Cyclobacteriaceae bacterium YHN15]